LNARKEAQPVLLDNLWPGGKRGLKKKSRSFSTPLTTATAKQQHQKPQQSSNIRWEIPAHIATLRSKLL
jgi:hypothetical protein